MTVGLDTLPQAVCRSVEPIMGLGSGRLDTSAVTRRTRSVGVVELRGSVRADVASDQGSPGVPQTRERPWRHGEGENGPWLGLAVNREGQLGSVRLMFTRACRTWDMAPGPGRTTCRRTTR